MKVLLSPLVDTKGLFRGKLRSLQWLIPVFIFVGCGQPESPQPKPEEKKAAETSTPQAAGIQQWRENRVQAKARAESEGWSDASNLNSPQTNTNAIDSAKALQKIATFPDRLKKIVGDSYQDKSDLRERAEKGDADAMAELASSFMQQGDVDSAFKWNLKAAELGNVRAENALGVAYVWGHGVEINYEEAVKWFKKAAEKGNINSQYSLGVRYVKGDHVEQNFAEAVKWFTLAANQGQPDSQVSLARRYAGGEGVTKDLAEAYKWALVAGKYWSAGPYRDDLMKKMTPEEIAEGERRAKQFKPVKSNSQ